ncbi:MAG: methyltransferase domain-containing protein [Lentisphaeraceae bacterium]|nr:methyltransferase domain-containing protein [Lentisphaeraceae bacterium]
MSVNNLLSTIDEYKLNSRLDEAIDLIKRQLHYSPYYYEFHYEIAGIYLLQNEFQSAQYHLERCRSIDSNKTSSAILLDFLNNKTDFEVSNKSISVLFDYYADSFDKELTKTLEYKTPQLIADAISKSFPKRQFKNMYDAGCGTGLCAQSCRGLVESIYGVDLSMNMLKEAKRKNLYTKLNLGDITHELGKLEFQVELITAADVFVYIQELKYFFQLSYQNLKQNGVMAFSIVSQGQEENTGRFCHSHEYITNLSDTYGFTVIAVSEENIRKNLEKWIRGKIYLLSKV